MDFRLEQCTVFNNRTYDGNVHHWLPHVHTHKPCALYCRARGTRTVVRLAASVKDGTPCRSGSLDMCINGSCWVGLTFNHLLN